LLQFNFRYEGAVIKQRCLRIQINCDFKYLIAVRDGVSIRLLVAAASASDSFQKNDLIDYFICLNQSPLGYLAIFLRAEIVLTSLSLL
jgi:hypothetical protein